ncbi:hypothetical protein ANCDUO_14426 [Ancylostoma duodenale]|uniref:Nipped-B protein n=1 Tax=Ancylostoma duodenale TaxID=51022 RepID=A0A0C2D064_9BILA|nr:hypothetical protein ANCDUO_14426 [Ancylostoma duodenale]
MGMLNDILNSLHRLPAGRNASNSYRFGSDQWISNTTVLVLQLLQSVVRVPERIHHRGEHHDDPDAEPDMQPDSIVPNSYKEVQALAQAFASGFLARCSSKGNKSEGEEDYRALFDSFLQDMLTAFNKPEFPAAEMFLQVVGNLLVKNCRNKSADIMIRTVSLEYLGLITSRLRSSMIWSVEDSKERMDLVVRTIKYEDNVQEDGTSLWPSVAEVDISDMTFSEKQMELERALLDYIIVNKDITVEIPSMLAQIVRRVQDEEGVKKLVLETFQTLWFQPVSERNTPALLKKVVVMTKVVQTCAEELKLEALETLFQALLKQGDKSTLAASRQIVDMFMDNVLTLENKMATENGVSSNNASNEDLAGAELHKANQERLLACLNTLTLFSKVLNEVIGMLERVVPLMSHPSDAFLTTFLCGVGVMARYFDFDSIIKDPEFEGKIFPAHLVRPDLSLNTDDVDPQDPEKPRRIRDNVFDVLFFFSSSSVPSMRYKAFVALVGKGKEQENLKEMDQAGSGLGSTVIQIYWQAVLQGYFSNNNAIRCHSAQVANLTYTQGLVTPGTSIATLIAMTTDPLPIVRNRVEAMLRDIDAKYAGMIQSTATQGVRKAYQLQLHIRGTSSDGTQRAIRGIRACDVSPYATTNGDTFFFSFRLFSEDSREKLRLEEWIFVADNVAMFPYQVRI